MGGRGSSNPGGNSNSVLGRNNKVPSEDEIKQGVGQYGGLPVRYEPRMSADARNHTTEIVVSDKFFKHDYETREHILNHEVAHNYSDEMISENSGRFRQFSSAFIKQKKVPEGSQAYERGQRTYFEGLYGDIGATAILETTTRAITEYLDDPSRLRRRSRRAYNEVKRFMGEKFK